VKRSSEAGIQYPGPRLGGEIPAHMRDFAGLGKVFSDSSLRESANPDIRQWWNDSISPERIGAVDCLTSRWFVVRRVQRSEVSDQALSRL